MKKEIRNLIKKEFSAIAKSRHNALKKLSIKNLNFNPFLLRILNLDKDLVRMINQLLLSATRRNAGSIALLGMTYGNREKVSNIIHGYSQVDWKIGKEFWEFIGHKGVAQEIYKIIAEVNKEFEEKGKTFSQLYDEKLFELQEAIRKRYDEGEKMWDKLFKDNM